MSKQADHKKQIFFFIPVMKVSRFYMYMDVWMWKVIILVYEHFRHTVPAIWRYLEGVDAVTGPLRKRINSL